MHLPNLAAGVARRPGAAPSRAGVRASGEGIVSAACHFTCSGDPNQTKRCVTGSGSNLAAAENQAHNNANTVCTNLSYGSAQHTCYTATCNDACP
jgi:hypothetical protein